MKTNKTKSVVCMFALLLSALAVPAQTYPDYAFASLSSTPFSNWSHIRVYSPTKALVLYKTVGSGTKVSLIDMGLGMKSVDLEPGYVVYDMEIAGNYLFMCGQYNLSKAFLAWLDITDLENSLAANITYQVADSATELRRMVAYKAPSGTIKVVAIGYSDYHNSNNGVYPPIWNACYGFGGTNIPASTIFVPCTPAYSCTLNFVVEFNNPQLHTPNHPAFYSFVVPHDRFHGEGIDDVVETKNHIVFVGNEGDNWDNLILHRCDKENVIATFNDYYKFPVPNPEGMTYYLCCHMAEDTIGIASRGSGILGQYETRIRVVDAASMVMTSSQLFDLNDYKTDPTDMVYCTGTQTLVMLQLQKFPPSLGGDYYGFLHLKPYATAPYYAEGMVEYSRLLSSSPLPFYSLDRVPDGKHYVSSGGECWLMNNSVSGMPTSNCRLADKINVKLEDNILVNHLNYGFYNCMVEFNVHQYNRAVINGAFTPVCYEL